MTELNFSKFASYLGEQDVKKQYKNIRKRVSQKIIFEINKLITLGIDNTHIENQSFYSKLISEVKNIDKQIIEDSLFRNVEPPDSVHWVGRNTGLFFDFRTCDEVETAAFRAGIDFPASSSKYLDFGCQPNSPKQNLIEILWEFLNQN